MAGCAYLIARLDETLYIRELPKAEMRTLRLGKAENHGYSNQVKWRCMSITKKTLMHESRKIQTQLHKADEGNGGAGLDSKSEKRDKW